MVVVESVVVGVEIVFDVFVDVVVVIMAAIVFLIGVVAVAAAVVEVVGGSRGVDVVDVVAELLLVV